MLNIVCDRRVVRANLELIKAQIVDIVVGPVGKQRCIPPFYIRGWFSLWRQSTWVQAVSRLAIEPDVPECSSPALRTHYRDPLVRHALQYAA
jgi:hypothetical protein